MVLSERDWGTRGPHVSEAQWGLGTGKMFLRDLGEPPPAPGD